MRMSALILTVIAAALPMAPASPQDRVNPSRKDQKEESAKKVKELQKERIATLKEMAVQLDKLYQHRRVQYEDLIEAKMLVHKAELDAAEKESERITLEKNILDVLKEWEDVAKQREQFPRTERDTKAAYLKVKAMRLEAEIRLLKKGVKPNPPPPKVEKKDVEKLSNPLPNKEEKPPQKGNREQADKR